MSKVQEYQALRCSELVSIEVLVQTHIVSEVLETQFLNTLELDTPETQILNKSEPKVLETQVQNSP